MCSLAATHHLIWKSIVDEHQPPLNLLLGVCRLTNLSKYLCLICVEVISWLANRQASLSPLILDYKNLPRESLSVTNREANNDKGKFSVLFDLTLALSGTIATPTRTDRNVLEMEVVFALQRKGISGNI